MMCGSFFGGDHIMVISVVAAFADLTIEGFEELVQFAFAEEMVVTVVDGLGLLDLPGHKHVLLARFKVALAELGLLEGPDKDEYATTRSCDAKQFFQCLSPPLWARKVMDYRNRDSKILSAKKGWCDVVSWCVSVALKRLPYKGIASVRKVQTVGHHAFMAAIAHDLDQVGTPVQVKKRKDALL